jgi:hypothetical protein
VLPVATGSADLGALTAYLRPINALRPRGNAEAEVLAWVEERAQHGGGDAGEATPIERLERWARQRQPPLRRERRLVARSFAGILFGAGLILYSIVLTIRGLVGAKPVAALVLDRDEDRGVTAWPSIPSSGRSRSSRRS